MRNRIGLIAAWALVTLIGISVTSAAVGSVRNNVTDTVAPRFTITDEVAAAESPTTVLPEATSTTTTVDDVSTTVDPAAADGDDDSSPDDSSAPSTTTPPSSTTAPSTTAAPSTSPTTTTAPPATTSTTTTTLPPAVVKSYSAIGGSVTVEVSGNTVTLLGAVPNAGFSAQEKSASEPDKVVVEFESEDHTSTIKVEVENGVIEVDIDEEPEGDD